MGDKLVIWDLPTRLFHWLLVLGVGGAWLSMELGEMEWHEWCGYSVLGLLLFRLGWGIFGSVHARFTDFVRGPGSVAAYLKGTLAEPKGHNPLGGWSVLALLLVLIVQSVTGLFNADDESFNGPLNPLVSSDWADTLGQVHVYSFDVLIVLIALHVGAVLVYLLRGKNLILPMFSGYKQSETGAWPPVPLWRALLWAAVCAAAIWLMLELAPEPEVYFF